MAPLYSEKDLKVLAPNDDIAKERYEKYKSSDPFPEIEPALLNSADIFDYVAATGMIHPFDPDKLKSASYAVKLLGKCVYWDEYGKKIVEKIGEKDEFVLKKNSIAFVTLEPRFRIPDYIALRFNLKIAHIYKGLLLGTGPLVDPGFNGRLSIPLHNLTANPYTFKGGESLIWMEFTKLSPNECWTKKRYPIPNRMGKYKPFPTDMSNWDVEDYLHDAASHLFIRSSIPDVVMNAAKEAEDAKKEVNSIKRWGIVATLGVLIGLVSLICAEYALVQHTGEIQSNLRIDVVNSSNELKKLNEEMEKLKKRLESVETTQTRQPDITEPEKTKQKLDKETPTQPGKEITPKGKNNPEDIEDHIIGSPHQSK